LKPSLGLSFKAEAKLSTNMLLHVDPTCLLLH